MCAQLDENGPNVMVPAQRLIAFRRKVRFDAHCLIVRMIRRRLRARSGPQERRPWKPYARSAAPLIGDPVAERADTP